MIVYVYSAANVNKSLELFVNFADNLAVKETFTFLPEFQGIWMCAKEKRTLRK